VSAPKLDCAHSLVQGNQFDLGKPSLERCLWPGGYLYYLIFAAYTLLNVNFNRATGWRATVNSTQLEKFVFSLAGICLITGILHGINVFALPFKRLSCYQ
jgi:hypothetical protein